MIDFNKKTRCPHCQRRYFSRIRRTGTIRFIPFSKTLRCDSCSAFCYEFLGMRFFRKVDILDLVNNELTPIDDGRRSAERHKLPLKLEFLKIIRDGEELEIEKDRHIYSMNFSVTGIAVRTEFPLHNNDEIHCKAQYHDFYLEAIVRRAFVDRENGMSYGCSLLGGGLDNFFSSDEESSVALEA